MVLKEHEPCERWIASYFGLPGGIHCTRELPDSQNMLVPTCVHLFPYPALHPWIKSFILNYRLLLFCWVCKGFINQNGNNFFNIGAASD